MSLWLDQDNRLNLEMDCFTESENYFQAGELGPRDELWKYVFPIGVTNSEMESSYEYNLLEVPKKTANSECQNYKENVGIDKSLIESIPASKSPIDNNSDTLELFKKSTATNEHICAEDGNFLNFMVGGFEADYVDNQEESQENANSERPPETNFPTYNNYTSSETQPKIIVSNEADLPEKLLDEFSKQTVWGKWRVVKKINVILYKLILQYCNEEIKKENLNEMLYPLPNLSLKAKEKFSVIKAALENSLYDLFTKDWQTLEDQNREESYHLIKNSKLHFESKKRKMKELNRQVNIRKRLQSNFKLMTKIKQEHSKLYKKFLVPLKDRAKIIIESKEFSTLLEKAVNRTKGLDPLSKKEYLNHLKNFSSHFVPHFLSKHGKKGRIIRNVSNKKEKSKKQIIKVVKPLFKVWNNK